MKSLVEQIRRLYPFRDFEANVREQVERLASSPLVPAGIPVTGFVQSFESHINQQLQEKPSGLPKGFQYCTTGVRTTPAGMFITYSATPI